MDRSAQDYAHTLEGEHAMQADRLRRQAFSLENEAKALRERADREDERAQWARMAAIALADAASDEKEPHA